MAVRVVVTLRDLGVDLDLGLGFSILMPLPCTADLRRALGRGLLVLPVALLAWPVGVLLVGMEGCLVGEADSARLVRVGGVRGCGGSFSGG